MDMRFLFTSIFIVFMLSIFPKLILDSNTNFGDSQTSDIVHFKINNEFVNSIGKDIVDFNNNVSNYITIYVNIIDDRNNINYEILTHYDFTNKTVDSVVYVFLPPTGLWEDIHNDVYTKLVSQGFIIYSNDSQLVLTKVIENENFAIIDTDSNFILNLQNKFVGVLNFFGIDASKTYQFIEHSFTTDIYIPRSDFLRIESHVWLGNKKAYYFDHTSVFNLNTQIFKNINVNVIVNVNKYIADEDALNVEYTAKYDASTQTNSFMSAINNFLRILSYMYTPVTTQYGAINFIIYIIFYLSLFYIHIVLLYYITDVARKMLPF